MPKRTDIQSILILGAGPIVIGQACEFGIVSLDSPDVSTESLLLALRKSILDAQKYGGDRTFLCEEGQPIPVLPLQVDIEPTTVEL